jgi:hypothetical protein
LGPEALLYVHHFSGHLCLLVENCSKDKHFEIKVPFDCKDSVETSSGEMKGCLAATLQSGQQKFWVFKSQVEDKKTVVNLDKIKYVSWYHDTKLLLKNLGEYSSQPLGKSKHVVWYTVQTPT